MDGPDDVGAREVEVLVASFELGPAEVPRREIPRLNHGAHGPVHEQDAALEGPSERGSHCECAHALILAQAHRNPQSALGTVDREATRDS